ncbi:trans-aconitate 2-methyltransferase [Elysia marginata]|uniref:Trans-aconitate 2-methyltransferase n=1 Tax=Elysia marginata TaxID=1093978 RepID=A0AAV4K1I1_9GAST|nr:trans-aconitate 2-methyltransferase [Elysia marginata]
MEFEHIPRWMMSSSVDKTKMYVNLEQSMNYAKHRPRYTQELFQTVIDYCRKTNPNLDIAVDVGCGPGMSTIGFGPFFRRVIGIDISMTQIACAPTNVPRCEFYVGDSDQLPYIASGIVDLFCSGQSFHLLPQKETFAEADRLLRPGGTIAIFGYEMPSTDNPQINAILQNMWLTMIPYWPQESTQLFEKFANLEMPYPDWERNDSLELTMSVNTEKFMGFLRSTWPVVAYTRDHPREDLIGDIAKQIREALANTGSGDQNFNIHYNFFIIMGHKPRN